MAIQISTIQDLINFSEGYYGYGTSSEYLEVELLNDLDFADLAVDDVPYNWAGCVGTWYVHFDGHGHKIDNIYYMDTTRWGFFDILYGSIQNLKLTNMYVTSTTGTTVGLVFRAYSALIKNCHVSGHIEALGNQPACGIYRYLDTTVLRECSVSGKVIGKASALGLGETVTANNCKIYNCNVHADITGGTTDALPFTSTNGFMVNCIYVGKIYAGNASYVGGYSSTLYNCILVYKAGSSTNFVYNSTFNNCYYDSTVATAAGFSLTSPTAATTEQLQSEQWLREHNFAI